MWICPECGFGSPTRGFCPTHGAPLTDAGNDLMLGQTIGQYRLVRRLGAGSMGTVYVGITATGERAALKLLNADAASNPVMVERFLAEARAVRAIRDAAMVTVHELAVAPDGRPFMVMELLDGAPLSALFKARAPLPLGTLCMLIHSILAGLAAAHREDIIHRDLKPDNLFLTVDGKLKILDFGVAKLRPDLTTGDATKDGSLIGTPQYMSPEQAAGKRADARSDLYSVGIILFEGATGRRPFLDKTLFALLRAHMVEPPPSPLALRPDIPAPLAALMLQLLEKDPERRPRSAHELGDQLLAAIRSLPAESYSPVPTLRADGTTAGSFTATRRTDGRAIFPTVRLGAGQPWANAKAPEPLRPSSPAPAPHKTSPLVLVALALTQLLLLLALLSVVGWLLLRR